MIPGGDPMSMLRGGNVGVGPIDGKVVTQDDLIKAQKMATISLRLFSNRQADNDAEQREVYTRLIVAKKLEDLEIEVPKQSVVKEIKSIFKDPTTGTFSRSFYTNVVAALPRGIRESDLHEFIRQNLGIRQLAGTIALADTMVTPMEGKEMSRREKRKAIANLAVFKGTNFTDKVDLVEAELMQYYTNNMPSYRTTETRAATFVEFAATNYFSEAESEFDGLQQLVDDEYQLTKDTLLGEDGNPTPEADAKAKIKSDLLLPRAKLLAKKDAYAFTKEIIEQTASTNVVGTNKLAVFKGQALLRGLNPVDSDYFNQFGRIGTKNPGPDGVKTAIDVSAEANSTAFRLTLEEPFPNEPLESKDSWFFMGLEDVKSSEVQPYIDVKGRVESGYRRDKVRELLREAGEAFYLTLTNELSDKSKSFEQVVTNAGYEFIAIPEFDIQTTTLTNFKAAVSLGTIKNTAFGLGEGEVSEFIPSGQNGYIVQLVELKEPSMEQVELDYTNSIPRIQTQMRLGTGGFPDWIQKKMSESGLMNEGQEKE